MKTSVIKIIGLVSLFILAASIASAQDNVVRKSMRITVTVPDQVKLFTSAAFEPTSNAELVSNACITTSSRVGAFQMTGSHNGSTNYHLSVNRDSHGFVNLSKQNTMQFNAQPMSCGAHGNVQLKLSHTAQTMNAHQPKVVSFKIVAI